MLWKSFTSLFRTWNRASSPAKRRSSKRQFRPMVEGLEERAVPANNVTAFVSGGTLVIQDDDLTVGGTNNQLVQLTGTATPGQVSVAGIGTTVNGAAAQTFSNVSGLYFLFGHGDDFAQLASAPVGANALPNFTGGITFIGDEGADQLQILGNVSASSLVFYGGNGNNTLLTGFGTATFTSYVYVVNGVGSNSVLLGTAATDVTTMNGLYIYNSSNTTGAADNVTFAGASLTNNGATVYYDYGVSTTGTSIANNATTTQLKSYLYIVTGGGADTIGGTGGTAVTGPVVIYTQEGNDAVTLLGGFGDYVYVVTGSGNDNLLLGGAVAGPVIAYLGEGDDGATLFGNFGSYVTVVAEGGNDTVNIGNLGGGAAGASIAGQTYVDLGLGNNTMNIDDTTFTGAVYLYGNDGTDQIFIEKVAASAAKTTFKSYVQAVLYGSDDFIDIGRDADAVNGGVFQGQVYVDGGNGNDFIVFVGAGTRGNVVNFANVTLVSITPA